MTTKDHTLLYDLVDLKPGNLVVQDIDLQDWGSVLVVRVLHNQQQPVTLTFNGCRGIEWHVIRSPAKSGETVQLIKHDLGRGQHQRTARLVTTVAEVIITYDELAITLA